MGLVTNRPAPLHPEILGRVVPHMARVLQLGRAVGLEFGAPTPPARRVWKGPPCLLLRSRPPPEVPPRTCSTDAPVPHRPQPASELTLGHNQGLSLPLCPAPGGRAGRAGCRRPDSPRSPGRPPAPDAPCPAVTPTGNGDFNAAAGSPQQGLAPPRHCDPPADCPPASAVFLHPDPPLHVSLS